MSVDQEIGRGERFGFGKNWTRFLESLSESRILSATEALKTLLGLTDLSGKRFVDVGSGSGLSSLAARRLGATVVSFDYDPDSVACTRELRGRHDREATTEWEVHEGSVLDAGFIHSLGQFDVVYSWGVLHHTGGMWRALDQVTRLVAPGGLLAIAIYNDQGLASRLWLKVKQIYCGSAPGRLAMCSIFIPYFMARGAAMDLLGGRSPLTRYGTTGARGMSVVRDWFDWIGGLPFEVARPGQIFDFYRSRGYELAALTTVGGAMGCNEYVFRSVRSA